MKENTSNIDINNIWICLSEDERKDACICFFQGDASSDHSVEAVLRVLAEVGHFRAKWLKRRNPKQNAGTLVKYVDSQDFRMFLDDFIRAWLVVRHQQVLVTFLGAAGIEHENGQVPDAVEAPTAEQFIKGIRAVLAVYDNRVAAIYFGFLILADGGFWINLNAALIEDGIDIEEMLASAPKEALVGSQDEAQENEAGSQLPETASNFTTLDNWLIRTAVASIFGEEGALSEEQLEDLIEEVIAQNTGRHHTLFHRGYFHALSEKPLVFEYPGDNESRRMWYLTGVLFGILRQKRPGEILALFEEQEALMHGLLENSSIRCGSMLLPHVYPILWEARKFGLLKKWLERHAPSTKPDALTRILIQLHYNCSALLRKGQSSEAAGMLELINKLLSDVHNLPEEFVSFLKPANDRKRAQAMQLEGNFQAAELILERLAEALGSTPESAKVLTDLALIQSGFRSLTSILPARDRESGLSIRDALKKSTDLLNEAITRFPEATNAHFVLGVVFSLEYEKNLEASDHLKAALTGMLKDEEAYLEAGLLDWTYFLLGLALLESAEPSEFHNASEKVRVALGSKVNFPLWLWSRVLQAARMFDDQSLAEDVGANLLENRGKDAFQVIWESSLAVDSAVMRAKYFEFMDSATLPTSELWEKSSSILPAALLDGQIELAQQALDIMEGIAIAGGEYRSEFIDLLQTDNNYSPAWDRWDAENALIKFHGLRGDLPESVCLLRNRFYQLREQGDSYSLADAEEVLSLMKRNGATDEELEPLRVLLVREEDPVELESIDKLKAGEKVSLLFIGGNETQQAYEKRLTADLRREYPGLQPAFYFPGWTSNWNVHLDKVLPMIPRMDAVILSPLVRTQFGKKVRASCDGETPWFPCTGKGRKSIYRCIISAATWAVGKNASPLPNS